MRGWHGRWHKTTKASKWNTLHGKSELGRGASSFVIKLSLCFDLCSCKCFILETRKRRSHCDLILKEKHDSHFMGIQDNEDRNCNYGKIFQFVIMKVITLLILKVNAFITGEVREFILQHCCLYIQRDFQNNGSLKNTNWKDPVSMAAILASGTDPGQK